MAEQYSTLPTDVMEQDFTQYWTNAGIMAATNDWRDENQSRRQQAQTDAGAATPQEKEDLVDSQEQRAERREQGGQPDPAEQVSGWVDGGVD